MGLQRRQGQGRGEGQTAVYNDPVWRLLPDRNWAAEQLFVHAAQGRRQTCSAGEQTLTWPSLCRSRLRFAAAIAAMLRLQDRTAHDRTTPTGRVCRHGPRFFRVPVFVPEYLKLYHVVLPFYSTYNNIN